MKSDNLRGLSPWSLAALGHFGCDVRAVAADALFVRPGPGKPDPRSPGGAAALRRKGGRAAAGGRMTGEARHG